MGALTNVLKSAMTRKHVSEVGNTGLATQSMGTSVKALEIVASGNREGSQAMVLAANTIGKKNQTQAGSAEVGKRMGQVKRWADQMEALKPMIEAGAKDFARGTKAQTSMAKTIGQTTRDMAVLNSATQYDMYKGHSAANVAVAVNQSAYGGSGWSA